MTGTTADLDDLLTDIADIDDDGIQLLVAGLRNIADRARAGLISREGTQLLVAVLAASPNATDVVGGIGLTIAQLLDDTAPALHELTDEARKTATGHGLDAAFRLTNDYLREPASGGCVALDHTH